MKDQKQRDLNAVHTALAGVVLPDPQIAAGMFGTREESSMENRNEKQLIKEGVVLPRNEPPPPMDPTVDNPGPAASLLTEPQVPPAASEVNEE